MRAIDADILRAAAETVRETTESFQELIDAQPTIEMPSERITAKREAKARKEAAKDAQISFFGMEDAKWKD